jgi:hypothetical protein
MNLCYMSSAVVIAATAAYSSVMTDVQEKAQYLIWLAESKAIVTVQCNAAVYVDKTFLLVKRFYTGLSSLKKVDM